MTGPHAGRDGHDVDALVTDRYLEALLSAHARGADAAPAAVAPSDQIRAVADRLARDLPRLHPSFLFEEALASRLSDVAARMRLPAAAGAEGLILPLPGRRPRAGGGDADDAEGGGDGVRSGFGRPLLIGGALTSAALSLAGAAYVAWRLNHTPVSPFVRAARAVNRTRLV